MSVASWSGARLSRRAITLLVVVSSLGVWLAPPASAQETSLVVGVVPAFDSPVAVGEQDQPALIQFVNNSSGPPAPDPVTLTNLRINPACATSAVDPSGPSPCTTPEPRPVPGNPVLALDAASAAGTTCPGGPFTITGPDPEGDHAIVPTTGPLTLAGVGQPGSSCVIAFTFDVVQRPTDGSTFQTVALTAASPTFPSGSTQTGVSTVTVNPSPPSITTIASASVPVGGQIHDTATLSGGLTPTGTITFDLFGPDNATCTGAPAFIATIPVNGNGSYDSPQFTPTAPGTYRWVARYSGDANNTPAGPTACNDPAESVVVTSSPTQISTVATPPPSFGSPMTDTATLSGGFNPTGTITFTLFGPDNPTCTGAPIFTSTVPVTGNGNYTSAPFTATAPGTYRWIATYSGDAYNAPAGPTACADPAETVLVPKAVPTIVTVASPSVPAGGAVTDTATISGAYNPTGTITFSLYGPEDATCAGPPAFMSAPVPVNGNGNYVSSPFTVNNAGTYRWVAAYSGDVNNAAVTTACNDPNESVVVTKANPSVATQASPTVPVGGVISDSATIAGGVNPTGTITFNLFGPDDATCAGAPVFTSVVPVTGNGAYPSQPFTTTAAGTYRWIATYSGDANNNPVAGACSDPNESVVVTKANPTVETTASASVPAGRSVSDTGILANGFNPTGTMTFNLYGPNNPTCSGSPAFSSTVPVNGNGNYNSGPFTPSAGTYRWVVTYSGDANNNPATSPCNAPFERVIVTPQRLTGRAYGASVGILPPPTGTTADTGEVSTTGAGTTSPPCVASLPGALNASLLCADVTTVLGPPTSRATASVAHADINTGLIGVPLISVDAVRAVSISDCVASTGRTTIANLTIGGSVVDVSNIAPNTTLNLGAAILILNEQIPVANADRGLTVNALHLIVPGLADIVLASATSDIHNCAFPPALPAPLPLFVGYADRVRLPEFVPNPWAGSPNTAWVGLDSGLLTVDSGALRLDNPTGAPVPNVRVTVDIGPHHFDLWGTNTIPANGRLVLFQTLPYNFDTSDVAPGPCDAPSPIIPVIHVSANGVTRDYRDYNKVLTTGGINPEVCTGTNEGQQWQPAGVVPVPRPHATSADFDGDLRTDVSVFRPSTATWFVQQSGGAGNAGVPFGTAGDLAVPADYTGDGTTDIAVFRPSNGVWYVRGGPVVAYGTAGDIPAPADYDGDAKADIAVFRPSTGTWFIQPSGGGSETILTFGATGDVPVPADYDGDGKADIAVFQPNGTWLIHPASGAPDLVVAYGTAGDIPVPADYDGDLVADIAVFRPSSGTWFVRQSGAPDLVVAWGTNGDIPNPGDYNGDGVDDIAVFRPANSVWFIRNIATTAWGASTDKPLPLPSAVRERFFP